MECLQAIHDWKERVLELRSSRSWSFGASAAKRSRCTLKKGVQAGPWTSFCSLRRVRISLRNFQSKQRLEKKHPLRRVRPLTEANTAALSSYRFKFGGNFDKCWRQACSCLRGVRQRLRRRNRVRDSWIFIFLGKFIKCLENFTFWSLRLSFKEENRHQLQLPSVIAVLPP